MWVVCDSIGLGKRFFHSNERELVISFRRFGCSCQFKLGGSIFLQPFLCQCLFVKGKDYASGNHLMLSTIEKGVCEYMCTREVQCEFNELDLRKDFLLFAFFLFANKHHQVS